MFPTEVPVTVKRASGRLLNLHSRVDLNGSGGLGHPVGADLYCLVTVRRHPAQPINLRKQVDMGNAVVL